MKLFSLLPKRLVHFACNSPARFGAALRESTGWKRSGQALMQRQQGEEG
jgi:hypothetical protein